MMLVRFDTLEPWKGEPLDGVSHPRSIERLWTAEELAGVGLAVPVRFTALQGERAVGPASYERDGDAVLEVRDTEPLVISAEAVNAERDRRVALGFVFNGVMFDSRVEDQKRINGAASLAHIALTVRGKQPGDLRWHDGEADFAWIAADNTLVSMDAPMVIEFGSAAARWESLHVFACRMIKDMSPIPLDYADDGYWP